MITPSQCRAARGLLFWTQNDLASFANVGVVTIRLFETLKTTPSRRIRQLLRDAFDAAGVELIGDDNRGGAGVRLKQSEDLMIRVTEKRPAVRSARTTAEPARLQAAGR